MDGIGAKIWVVPEGFIPEGSTGPSPQMTSHGTLCILNAGDEPAELEIELYFTDRDPAGPYRLAVEARRTMHVRFNELEDPEPAPRGTDFASVVRSNRAVVVQHTRLDSRQAANALMTTMAYPAQAGAGG